MRSLLAGLWFAALGGTAWAQDSALLLSCSSKTDDKERLACFDNAMRAAKAKAPAASGSMEGEAVSSTKEIVAVPTPVGPPKPEAFRLIDPADLYVAPNKYVGRPIELRQMRCLHADKNEYRCVAPGSVLVAIFTVQITPSSEQEAIQNDCGEIRKMTISPKCQRTIRFVPLKVQEDLVNGYTKRLVVLAASVETALAGSNKRR